MNFKIKFEINLFLQKKKKKLEHALLHCIYFKDKTYVKITCLTHIKIEKLPPKCIFDDFVLFRDKI